MNELWKDIDTHIGKYQISSLGRVKILNPRYKNKCFLKPNTDKDGYLYVILSNPRKTAKVHRLVAKAFPEICGKWFEGCQINHKDECKNNNIATNLEVCDAAYNSRYGMRTQKIMQKKVKEILQIYHGTVVGHYTSLTEAAKTNGYSISGLSSALHKKRKSYKKYQWVFAIND